MILSIDCPDADDDDDEEEEEEEEEEEDELSVKPRGTALLPLQCKQGQVSSQ